LPLLWRHALRMLTNILSITFIWELVSCDVTHKSESECVWTLNVRANKLKLQQESAVAH
jgi:hypothetical protein